MSKPPEHWSTRTPNISHTKPRRHKDTATTNFSNYTNYTNHRTISFNRELTRTQEEKYQEIQSEHQHTDTESFSFSHKASKTQSSTLNPNVKTAGAQEYPSTGTLYTSHTKAFSPPKH
jgi:cell division protein FtsN